MYQPYDFVKHIGGGKILDGPTGTGVIIDVGGANFPNVYKIMFENGMYYYHARYLESATDARIN